MATELKTGDLCIRGSGQFADYRDQLLSWEECEPQVANYCQKLGFEPSAQGFVEHLRCPLPRCCGTGKRVAADGTQYDLAEENLLAEKHIRYGEFGGIAYHHVCDMYILLFPHFIACGVWEAVRLVDGLMKNQSDIQPDTIHVDTQGQNLPVFALSHLLGIKLMPRIRNWKDLKFYRPGKETHYQHIESLFCEDAIDWELIQTHWQDLLRVVLSMKAGKVVPSMLLRKLTSYSRKNRLYQAFRELGHHLLITVYL